MSEPVIKVEDISKSYIISHRSELKADYGTLKDDFTNFFKKPFSTRARQRKEVFWALKDISFEVNQGEIFGIIGKNGSGKSTLLKILSRISEPTKGTAYMRGRTASLLEVGTGFHPELTGRENIFFNGSMIGMSRREIRNKFEEIVAFSGIEKFLDTPVKFYSSGMYVRLAFSVAAHLDSDILILDEVLSVGDAAFQEKSLDKILSTIEDGRTVIIVTHSMDTVEKLCNRGLLLKSGKIAFLGNTDRLVEEYKEVTHEEPLISSLKSSWENDGKTKNKYFTLKKMYIVNESGKRLAGEIVPKNKPLQLVIEGNVNQDLEQPLVLGYSLYNESRQLLFTRMVTDTLFNDKYLIKKSGPLKLVTKLPMGLLNEGVHRIGISGYVFDTAHLYEPDNTQPPYNPSIYVTIRGGFGGGSPYWKTARSGLIAPAGSSSKWEIIR